MIYALSVDETTLFVMLSESDVADKMRPGNSMFVDGRHLQGKKFEKVILSLHKTNEDAIALIHQAGGPKEQVDGHHPTATETRCAKCEAIVERGSTFEGRCIVCWATEAKARRAESN